MMRGSGYLSDSGHLDAIEACSLFYCDRFLFSIPFGTMETEIYFFSSSCVTIMDRARRTNTLSAARTSWHVTGSGGSFCHVVMLLLVPLVNVLPDPELTYVLLVARIMGRRPINARSMTMSIDRCPIDRRSPLGTSRHVMKTGYHLDCGGCTPFGAAKVFRRQMRLPAPTRLEQSVIFSKVFTRCSRSRLTTTKHRG